LNELDIRAGRWAYALIDYARKVKRAVMVSTVFGEPVFVTPGWSPRWSLDGTRFAFLRDDGIWLRVPEDDATETRVYAGEVDSIDW